MPNKVERFTQRARRVMSLAQEEAERLQHVSIGTEHLLLGLLRELNGVAGRALHNLGFEYSGTALLVEQRSQISVRTSRSPLNLSPGTKKVLELSVDEARKLGDHYIGTEHLLLGLLRHSEAIITAILTQSGTDTEKVRAEVLHVLAEHPLPSTPSPPPYRRPPNKMGRFTQRARFVLSLAQEEAERLQHNYIGTEHLLLGLMREEGGAANRVLRALGVEQRRLEALVERLTRASTRTTTTPIELSPGANRILELAVEEARRLGHHYIGTEHLLLGLVRQSQGVQIDVLEKLGISPEEIRRQIRRVLQQEATERAEAESSAEDVSASPPKDPTKSFVQGMMSTASNLTEHMRILELIEQGKLTAAEGAQLLKVMQPPTEFVYSTLLATLSYIFNYSGAEEQHLRLVITEKTTGETKSELKMSIQQMEEGIANLITAIFHGKINKIILEDEQYPDRIEIYVERDEKK